MVDNDNRCVYNGLEYTLTGRYATNKVTHQKVFEIQPTKTFGFDDLNIWVALEDLFLIEDDTVEGNFYE